jgi:hypothetical protein
MSQQNLKKRSASEIFRPEADYIAMYFDKDSDDWRYKDENGVVQSIRNPSAISILGSRAIPEQISSTGITNLPSGDNKTIYIEGLSGDVDITANPQIIAGTTDGQQLEIRGRNDSKKVLFQNGNGLSLNGPINMGEDYSLTLKWDLVNWVETGRRENA